MDRRRTKTRIAKLLFLAMTVPVMALAQTQRSSPPAPTFTKDVAPILQRSCQSCHREDSIGTTDFFRAPSE